MHIFNTMIRLLVQFYTVSVLVFDNGDATDKTAQFDTREVVVALNFLRKSIICAFDIGIEVWIIEHERHINRIGNDNGRKERNQIAEQHADSSLSLCNCVVSLGCLYLVDNGKEYSAVSFRFFDTMSMSIRITVSALL